MLTQSNRLMRKLLVSLKILKKESRKGSARERMRSLLNRRLKSKDRAQPSMWIRSRLSRWRTSMNCNSQLKVMCRIWRRMLSRNTSKI